MIMPFPKIGTQKIILKINNNVKTNIIMKKLTKNILSSINIEIPALTEDGEGKLHGGFVEPDDPFGLPIPPVNTYCGNSNCPNRPCTNPSCVNIVCSSSPSSAVSPDCVGNKSMLI